MKALFVLIGSTLISLVILWVFSHQWYIRLAGNIGMSVMLLFTAIGHFVFTKGMSMMLPEYIPLRREIVWLTGAIEIAAAIGLLIPEMRHLTAVWLLVFLVVVLSANFYAAHHNVDYQKATYTGPGRQYLQFRVPLQFFFMGWVWFFSW